MVALVVLLLFRQHVEDHLFYWCVAAPVVVMVGWVIFEQHAIFARQGVGFDRYLYDPVAWVRAVMAFTCAAIASVKFYRMNRLA